MYVVCIPVPGDSVSRQVKLRNMSDNPVKVHNYTCTFTSIFIYVNIQHFDYYMYVL